MTRTRIPAPGHKVVKEVLDLLRPSLEEIGRWLPSNAGGPHAARLIMAASRL